MASQGTQNAWLTVLLARLVRRKFGFRAPDAGFCRTEVTKSVTRVDRFTSKKGVQRDAHTGSE